MSAKKVVRYFNKDDKNEKDRKLPKSKTVIKPNQKVNNEKTSTNFKNGISKNTAVKIIEGGKKDGHFTERKTVVKFSRKVANDKRASINFKKRSGEDNNTEKNIEDGKKVGKPVPYNLANIKTGIHKKKFEEKGKKINFLNEATDTVKTLLLETAGYLEADDGETTTQFTQGQIVQSVDITAAAKQFELHLRDFGPYRTKYTRNGRHMLLGGRMGHIAAMDWVTKNLHCELNVMESVHDICWLHIETMFAVAQKKWVYIYDNQGLELHCIKKLNSVSRLEFLPYHFLLAAASTQGYLSWLDVSIGEMVAQFNTNLGRLMHITHNPYNAVVCLGHAKGVVSMWTPNTNQPVAKMLCHRAPITALHIDPSGNHMVTASTNREIKIWDVRKLQGPVQVYSVRSVPNNVAFSQNNLMAVSMGNVVEVYRDCIKNAAKRPYLLHRFNNPVENLTFCPFEDVLGVATDKGFASLLVPGAGEANFDGYEANPFQTKSQRRENEVKALLEKIQPDLISLQPGMIAEVDVKAMEEKVDAKKKVVQTDYKKLKLQYKVKKGSKVKPKLKPKLKTNNKLNF